MLTFDTLFGISIYLQPGGFAGMDELNRIQEQRKMPLMLKLAKVGCLYALYSPNAVIVLLMLDGIHGIPRFQSYMHM